MDKNTHLHIKYGQPTKGDRDYLIRLIKDNLDENFDAAKHYPRLCSITIKQWKYLVALAKNDKLEDIYKFLNN